MTLGRMIKFGVQSFWRNIWLSAVTVIILTLNLFLMSLVIGLNVVGEQALTAVRAKVNLSVFFTPTTSEQQVKTIREDLLQKPEVKSIEIITRQQHLDDLKAAYPNSGLVNAAIELLGDNPLGPGLVISARSFDGYTGIVNALKNERYETVIEDTGNDFESNRDVINTISRTVGNLRQAAIWLNLFFALIAALMVFNTIRVNIYTHSDEIGIMKLVGASDTFVRGPFIVTSIMYGLLSALITTALFVPVLSIANPFLNSFFAGYDINILGYFYGHVWFILGLEVLVGCSLSVLSSLFAIGRYLRV